MRSAGAQPVPWGRVEGLPLSSVVRVLVPFALVGCTRVTELGANGVKRSMETTANDSGLPVDSGVPVSGEPVCIPGEAPGYRLPSTRWGLSVLFASRRLSEPVDNTLHLDPAWFLAAAWQTDAFGCGGYGTPWSNHENTVDGGCYDLQPGTHWVELERLFPRSFPASGWPEWVRGDSPERSSLALAQAAYAGHLLLRRVDQTDPDTWLSASTDPRVAERLATFFHVEGPWSATAARAITGCADDLHACATHDLVHHLEGLEDKLATLSTADCARDPISRADLDAFIDGLAGPFPDAHLPAVRTAAHAANSGHGFDVDGLAIIHAVEATLDAPLACPEDGLWDQYRYSCF